MGIRDRCLSSPVLAGLYFSAWFLIPYFIGRRIGYYAKDKYERYKISRITLTEQDYIDNHKRYGKRIIAETEEE